MAGLNDRWWRVLRFVQEVRQELGKVTWPTSRELRAYTVVVVVAVVVVTTFAFTLDQIFNRLVLRWFGQ